MKPRRHPPPSEAGRSGHERWLISYSDFVTLLLAFFVTMYSITRLDSEKLSQAQLSIHRALNAPIFLGGFPLTQGVGDTPAAGVNGDLPGAVLQARSRSQIEEVAREVEKTIKEANGKGDYQDIHILVGTRGLIVHLPEFLFFGSGDAELRPEVKPLLDKLAGILRKIPNHVVIEGHTDNVPIHTPQFPSNWELSTFRATTLVRYFIEHYKLEPSRFTAAGYGEYAPLASNHNEAGRRQNRRVDLIIQPLAGGREP